MRFSPSAFEIALLSISLTDCSPKEHSGLSLQPLQPEIASIFTLTNGDYNIKKTGSQT